MSPLRCAPCGSGITRRPQCSCCGSAQRDSASKELMLGAGSSGAGSSLTAAILGRSAPTCQDVVAVGVRCGLPVGTRSGSPLRGPAVEHLAKSEEALSVLQQIFDLASDVQIGGGGRVVVRQAHEQPAGGIVYGPGLLKQIKEGGEASERRRSGAGDSPERHLRIADTDTEHKRAMSDQARPRPTASSSSSTAIPESTLASVRASRSSACASRHPPATLRKGTRMRPVRFRAALRSSDARCSAADRAVPAHKPGEPRRGVWFPVCGTVCIRWAREEGCLL